MHMLPDRVHWLFFEIWMNSASWTKRDAWHSIDREMDRIGSRPAHDRGRAVTHDSVLGTSERLDNIDDVYRIYRCRTIMNCTNVCPKGLNPAQAIGKMREMLARRVV